MKRGFTLIELLASIVVIAIISLVSIPIITGVVNKTKLNALKVSAENLIDATRLYNAQYNNEETVRFDIANNKISSSDTTNLLKYKGSIKAGTVIVDTKGRSVICVTDGSRSAYKNYSENVVSVSNNKTCNIPAGGSIVYLGNEATITELTNQELTQQLQQLQNKIAELENNKSHVGMIIESTTLNTEEKVKAIYGGQSWSKIEGRFLLGESSNYEINSTGGEATHTLTVAEMPSHSHNVAIDGNKDYPIVVHSNGSNMSGYHINTGSKVTGNYFAMKTLSAGSSQAHNNMPPYKVVYIWERTA
ncbi:MAG: prepilin-type N-terminal cleavage/methylation domain-containing protein [Bacilli bacterium]|nr:prepilin-type N-terminal cleavage/methylation domain-containing protein [Bacilli bacterium]